MSEGNAMMTYVTLHDSRATDPSTGGVPALVLRLGLALQRWAVAAADRDARRTPSTPSGAGAAEAHDIRVTRLF